MTLLTPRPFVDTWRRAKCRAFDLARNSTARRTVDVELWSERRRVYANANLSIYSAQRCEGSCPFCVEKLRPASRGFDLAAQKVFESDDDRYFAALEEVLRVCRPLDPSVSITGGEPSKDPRLPRILRTLAEHGARKRTLTTNGSGLLDPREGRLVVDWIGASGIQHLNVSRALPDDNANSALMGVPCQLSADELRFVAARARDAGSRVRLSCVLITGGVSDLAGIVRYLDFARSIGVDNVVFRQLMLTDASTHLDGAIVRQSNAMRVQLEPILDEVSADPSFTFQRQVLGYYYYVEVWRHAGVDVVFEEADLAQLERVKKEAPDVIHELVFHPNALLASTWQPWDGLLGPHGGGPIARRDARPHEAVTSSGPCIRGREARQTQSLV
jgi:molybdenum cofactor biosynthesis enzyme MoaA